MGKRHYFKSSVSENIEKEKRGNMIQWIKFSLNCYGLTQVWVIQQLSERGIFTDKSEFSSILSGVRTGAKTDVILKETLNILNDYKA